MLVREVKILSEGLWESIKTDLTFFSPVQLFVKKLSELPFQNQEDIDEALIYLDKIENFFDKYKANPRVDSFYITPALISLNNDSVQRLRLLLEKLIALDKDKLGAELGKKKAKPLNQSKVRGKIFIGHGRSKLWARLKLFLQHDHNLTTLIFEDESRTGETIVDVLTQFLEHSSFAILIMTAEDETAGGTIRARQNVIHEAGLFQGRLGFENVIILKQNQVEEFSNIAGLQYIPFDGDNIEQTFYELQRTLKKVGLIN
ncbi:TIR domain-containing protein [Pedobacter kyungheensis]|uniref:TIR domain-containing protein n=1 Tax=Pedobacter kyungheensis TaxID=1069985 RepID=UPI000689A31F|nr:nucleotide-binding protein [Pedobacter kyungheensis]